MQTPASDGPSPIAPSPAAFSFEDDHLPDFRASGYYVQAARFVTPRWQLVVKFERFDPNVKVRSLNLAAFTTGLNYYLAANRIELMTNCVARDVGRREHLFQCSSNTSYTEQRHPDWVGELAHSSQPPPPVCPPAATWRFGQMTAYKKA